MAEHKEEQPEEFKVVDRRLFTPEGERRPGADPEPPKEPPKESLKAAPKPPPAAKPPVPEPPQSQARLDAASEPSGRPSAGGPAGPVKFDQLVMSLVTTAMLQMGMATRPGEIAAPPDFPAAQETLEILSMLQQKTKGNLTPEEEDLLTNSLYELRLAFVELTRAPGRPPGHSPGNLR